jgi:ribonuclease HI
LVILIDSVAAIRRLKQQLTWFRRKDFRPHTRRTKDFDVVQEIFLSLDERGRNGAHTTMVKVHGHTGEPLHAVADAMPTEGADRKMEVDDTRNHKPNLRVQRRGKRQRRQRDPKSEVSHP